MTARELRCAKGCAVLEGMSAQDVLVCPVCHFGVTGVEVHANRGRNLQALIDDGVIGHAGVVVDAPGLESGT